MTDIRSGHCKGGPRDGKLLVTRDPGPVRVPDSDGFYVHTPPSGPIPSGWR